MSNKHGKMLLGFKKQFAPKILDGSKVMTVRQPRKVEPKIGEVLHMYTGLRTRNCEKITSDHTLRSIQNVDIIITEYTGKGRHQLEIIVDGRSLDGADQNNFIRLDGFDSVIEFMDYWKKASTWHRLADNIVVYMNDDLVIYHWSHGKF